MIENALFIFLKGSKKKTAVKNAFREGLEWRKTVFLRARERLTNELPYDMIGKHINMVYSTASLLSHNAASASRGCSGTRRAFSQEENRMTSYNRFYKRALALLLVLAMGIAGMSSLGAFSVSATVEHKYNSDSLVRTSLDEIENVLTSTSYSDYLKLYGSAATAKSELQIDLLKELDPEETTASYNFVRPGDDLAPYNNSTGTSTLELPDGAQVVLLCGDDGRVSFRINVTESGFYNINVGYYTGNVAVYGILRDEDGNPVLQSNGDPTLDMDTLASGGNYAAIERYILIDGKVPYSEARSIELSRIWNDLYEITDKDGKTVKMYSNSEEFKQYVREHYGDYENYRPFSKDGNGNELKPEKVLVSQWTETFLYDSTGYYNDPLSFYLEEGEHVLSLQAVRETVAIDRITLCHAESAPSYDEYYASNGGDGAIYKGGEQIIVQAEYATTVSERTIYQLNNRSSIYSQPQDPALIRLNMIGGEKWEYVGQWVEWEVEVPESGFYSIVPRTRQSYYSGVYVSRKIYINGELPFREAGYLRFDYSSSWQTDPLSYWQEEQRENGETELVKKSPLFYLEKGVNTIRMEVVLGDMADILSRVNQSLTNINAYYRKILMITGASPDKYRDYRFERLIPDVLKGLREESDNLYQVSKDLANLMGGMGEHSATLDRVANVCHRMGYYPTTIASYMSSLKDYTASLGTWLTDTQNQPLDIDYLCIQSQDTDAPRAEPNFFAKFWGGVEKFFWSFFSDYDSLGSSEDGTGVSKDYAIEVWTVTSRDQAQIVRSLVDDSFTPTYGIPVVVKLVAGGTLLPATLAGTGPDVYMGAGQGDPVNYAIRSAVLSLNNTGSDASVGYNFNDLSRWAEDPVYKPLLDQKLIPTFDEVTARFAPAAMRPLTLYGQSYGIPETMSFNMMFYRKDIFVELGVAPPDTWDEFYNLIYTLQAAELQIGVPIGIGTSTILMYQQDETFYQEGNYDEYLNLFRTYYNEVGHNGYDNVDDYLLANGYTYIDADGNLRPTTDGIAINLDSDISLATFKKACELITLYSFPYSYVVSNRFRSGEMPLAIADYTTYNSLIVFAPEINGLWEFTPLPGIASEDPETGETVVDNTTVGAVSAMMMMRSVTDTNALGAWTFMQWWMSADVQTSFGNEMIALLGPSAKQATANMEALAGMSWSKDEYDNLFAQFNAVECTPEYPGSYIVGRYTNFAFLDVKNDGKDPVEAMRSYINDINAELTRKRTEFGLLTARDIQDMKNYLIEKKIDWMPNKEGGN